MICGGNGKEPEQVTYTSSQADNAIAPCVTYMCDLALNFGKLFLQDTQSEGLIATAPFQLYLSFHSSTCNSFILAYVEVLSLV